MRVSVTEKAATWSRSKLDSFKPIDGKCTHVSWSQNSTIMFKLSLQPKSVYPEVSMPDLVSITVPCYNEQESLPIFLSAISDIAMDWPESKKHPELEVIAVDDGSSDDTLSIMRQASKQTWPFTFRYISFSRNFGKEAAMLAGLEAARGDYVCTMDVDLQDPPSLLPQMYAKLRTGEVDCVATRRVTREGEPPIRSLFARLFYKIINRISDADIVDGARDYRLMSRQMVNAVISLRERNRFSKGIFSWVGFRTEWLPYVNVERAAGETHWNFFSLALYAIDGITAFSTAPLAVASVLGTLLCLVALVAIVVVIVKTLAFGDPVGGWPSLFCIIVFLGGIQLLCLGICGQYLAKTYLEVKSRPVYIVHESSDDRRDEE